MGSIRRLRLVQIISLVVWIGSVALFASGEGPLRSLWMVLWIVAFVVLLAVDVAGEPAADAAGRA